MPAERAPIAVFATPPREYDHEDQSQFRVAVEQFMQDVAARAGEVSGSGTAGAFPVWSDEFGLQDAANLSEDGGGDVLVGSDPGGSELLRVGGTVRIEGTSFPMLVIATSDSTNPTLLFDNQGVSKFQLSYRTGQPDLVISVDDGAGGLAAALQVTDAETTTPDIRVPNNLIVGTDPGGSDALRVDGGVLIKNASIYRSFDTGGTVRNLIQLSGSDEILVGPLSGANIPVRVPGIRLEVDGDFDHDGSRIGFFGTATALQQTVDVLTNNVSLWSDDDTIDDPPASYDQTAFREIIGNLTQAIIQIQDLLETYGLAA